MQDEAHLGGEYNPLGIVQKSEFLHYQIHKPESVQENETHKIHWEFEIQKWLPNSVQKTRPSANYQNKIK